jgi:DNA primase
MARIPDDEIQRLKREVSLERLVTSAGVELKRHGADLIGLCPFHDDRGPSLVVTPSKNLWHCLGACQQGGSVVDWVMKVNGVSFRHAVEILRGDLLAGRHGDVVVPTNGNGKGSKPALPSPIEPDADDHETLARVVAYYHETLKQSPEALGYLEKRGINSAEALSRFNLGFANRTLGYRLSSRQDRERLQKLGLIRDSGHEHFNGSLVIPIFGEHGEVLEMYGRKITPDYRLRKGTPFHLYLPGPHRGVWNVEALAASKTVILCEALIDALSFWCAGFRNVTASYGTSGFTDDHLAAFKRYGTETVLLAYDRDEAGERAASALAEKLIAQGITCYRIQFPKGMDANEYACKVTPAEKGLGVLVRNAVWLGKGKAPVVVDLIEATRHELEASTPAIEAPAVSSESAAVSAPPEPAADADPSHTCAPALSSLAALAAREDSSSPEPPRPSGERNGDEVVIVFGDRRYRVRGLGKNLAHGALKVNLLVSRRDNVHVDTLDLYSSRQRAAFVKQAAAEIGSAEETIKTDVGQVLMRLEQIQDERIQEALKPKSREVTLSEAERAAALELLAEPKLLDRILADFEACGVVGEETNKLVGYLAAVSRKLEEPLAVIIQSSSAAGKSALMEAILAFMPEEDRVKYSAMTGQSLFYMGESDLAHKILAIVEEQGAEKATYALKLLQSEGELTIASTGKDPATGRLVTQEYRVEGPVMIFLTTTAIEIDEELLNRCLVLTVDEDREQTRAIHRLQREKQTLEGLLARQAQPALLKIHRDAQRLLKPILVANPYARHLTFLDDRTRTRRDHVKYLTLIRAIALLHQYQRPIKTATRGGLAVPYIEVTLDDIATANNLAHQVLGRSLDELPPQTRRLLMALDRMVSEACAAQAVARQDFRFSRRQVREHTGWTYDQVRVHVDRLVELEYVLTHKGSRGQSFEYELLYDGQGKNGAPFLTGLLDVEAIRQPATTGGLGGEQPQFGGSLGCHLAPIGVPLGGESTSLSPAPAAAIPRFEPSKPENAHLDAARMPSRRTSPLAAARA